MAELDMGAGPPPDIIAACITPPLKAGETRGKSAGVPVDLVEASRAAKPDLAGTTLLKATRRAGSDDRAKASAAGVGRVTSVRPQYVNPTSPISGRIVPVPTTEGPFTFLAVLSQVLAELSDPVI